MQQTLLKHLGLRLNEEVRSIEQAMRQSEFRDNFDIKQQWAVRISDLQGYLLRYKPNIIHFSGHGSKTGEIILEDEVGRTRPVRFQALSELLFLFNKDRDLMKDPMLSFLMLVIPGNRQEQ